MLKIKKSEIPNFLKKSHFFEGFDENLDEELEIPEKNFKKDLGIKNSKDYINLLLTVDYFIIEIPIEINDFENSIDNEDEILKVLIKNKYILLINNRLTYFKKLILERNEILNFSANIALDYPMQDLEEEDEDEQYSKNPLLLASFYFKNKIVDYNITFESNLNDLIEFFKSIDDYKILSSKKTGIVGYFFNHIIRIIYKENVLSLYINNNRDNNETICKNNTIKFYFEAYTKSFDYFLNSVREILLSLQMFRNISKEKKLMGGYDFSGKLLLVKNVFGETMEIDNYLNEFSEEIMEETGKKLNAKKLEKWLIKNNRIFNIKNGKLSFLIE